MSRWKWFFEVIQKRYAKSDLCFIHYEKLVHNISQELGPCLQFLGLNLAEDKVDCIKQLGEGNNHRATMLQADLELAINQTFSEEERQEFDQTYQDTIRACCANSNSQVSWKRREQIPRQPSGEARKIAKLLLCSVSYKSPTISPSNCIFLLFSQSKRSKYSRTSSVVIIPDDVGLRLYPLSAFCFRYCQMDVCQFLMPLSINELGHNPLLFNPPVSVNSLLHIHDDGFCLLANKSFGGDKIEIRIDGSQWLPRYPPCCALARAFLDPLSCWLNWTMAKRQKKIHFLGANVKSFCTSAQYQAVK